MFPMLWTVSSDAVVIIYPSHVQMKISFSLLNMQMQKIRHYCGGQVLFSLF